eukprot:jgi/Mesen1/3629/ME000020S03160
MFSPVQIEDREPPRQRLVIEEVDGDDEEEEEEEAHSEQPEQSPRRTRARRERHEPVIEHPEDDDVPPPSPAGFSGRRAASDYNVYRETGDASRGWGHQQQQQQQLSSSGARVWSYSSSSVSYSGFGGQPYYSSSSTRRCGPNGVVEEQHQEHDAVEGRKTMSVLRGLGEKSRSVMRTKRAHGPEQSRRRHGLTTPGGLMLARRSPPRPGRAAPTISPLSTSLPTKGQGATSRQHSRQRPLASLLPPMHRHPQGTRKRQLSLGTLSSKASRARARDVALMVVPDMHSQRT